MFSCFTISSMRCTAAAWLSIVAQSPTPPVVGEVRGHRSYEHRLMPDSASSPEMDAAMEADPEAAASWQQLLETVILQWWEDDVAITIVASPASEARRMAESLRAVDESDWEVFATSATGLPDLHRPDPPDASLPPSAERPTPPADRIAPSRPEVDQRLSPTTTLR